VLIDGGEIVEARIAVEGFARSGSIIQARLVGTGAGGRNAVARDADGNEYLLPGGAPSHSEGATLRIEVTREQVLGKELWKRPLARVANEPTCVAEAGTIGPHGREVQFPAAFDELANVGWIDLLDEARTGIVRFGGGELNLTATPAMTLIDVDGWSPPDELAVGGAARAAQAIRRLDIGGSIGIDLPTTSGKAARLAAAAAIDKHLPQRFERTAVNGFGFVQIVRARTRASLVELAGDRPAFEARALLRRLAFEPPGEKRLVCHPAVAAVLQARPPWLDALARQVGGAVSLREEQGLPMSGAYAESV
jgi:hypothetical protein